MSGEESAGSPLVAEARWKAWEQAWTHFRHLETMRSQYLGFFFTVLLGVTVLGANAVLDKGLDTPGSWNTLVALGVGLDLLAAFLLLAVGRIGQVLDHFRCVMDSIQDELRVDLPRGPDRRWLDAWPRPGTSRIPWRLNSTQGAAETVLILASLGFPLLLLIPAVSSLAVEDSSTATIAWCWGGLLSAVVISGIAHWARGSSRPMV